MSTNKILVFAENMVSPGGGITKGPFFVMVKEGKIHKISEANSDQCERCDAITCHLLAPGFVDIHNHGLGGSADAVEFWKNPEYTCSKSVSSGTTSILASIVFPEDTNKIDSLLEKLNKTVGRKDIGAVVEGIHAEGPLIAESGCLPKDRKRLNDVEFEDLLDKMPSLKVMTLSPSVIPKLDYQAIKMLHERDVVAALGHDRQASEQEIINALLAGGTQRCHITHMFNLSKFHHRSPGLVNFGLLDEYPFMEEYENVISPTIELIGDLVHVHPLAIKLALSSRSWENIAFVTNCIADKRRRNSVTYCGTNIEVDNDSKVVKRTDDNTIIGGCTTMLEIFKTLTDDFDVPPGKAFMMLSENPARIANLDNVGSIEIGKDANLLMFDSKYVLMKAYVDGRMVFRTSVCRRKRVVSTESFDESFEN